MSAVIDLEPPSVGTMPAVPGYVPPPLSPGEAEVQQIWGRANRDFAAVELAMIQWIRDSAKAANLETEQLLALLAEAGSSLDESRARKYSPEGATCEIRLLMEKYGLTA